MTQTEHKLAEILVGGHEDALLDVGELEHGIVRDARRELGEVDNVVSVEAQTSDDGRVDAFVSEKPQATDLETG